MNKRNKKGICLFAGCAFAVVPQALVADEEVVKLERIIVTGSNIKRVDAESALPVQTFTREEIQRAGIATAEELVRKIAAGSNNYNTSLAIGQAARAGMSGASLRGLGGSNTLVLLNGRRIANYAFSSAQTDLNAIPMAAVEWVEVLKDGASAIYGSDAIGGVINFITKTDYTGAEVAAYSAVTQHAGGNADQMSLSGGYGSLIQDRFNIFASLDHQNTTAIHARDREFAKTGYIPDAGVNKLSTVSYPANIVSGTQTFNPGLASGCAPPASLAVGGRCRYDFPYAIDILAPAERTHFYTKLSVQIAETHQAYFDYSYARNRATFVTAPSTASATATFTGAKALYPAGGPFYPSGLGLSGDLNLYWRTVDAGPRIDEALSTAERLLAGVKGMVNEWDYDIALSQSTSKVSDSYIDGWLYESKLLPALYSGRINPFGAQTAAGQALLNSAKVRGEVRSATGKITSFDARGSKEVAHLPAGPLALALGTEFRAESYSDDPKAVMSSGDILGGPGNMGHQEGRRNVRALYAELSVPVVKTLEGQLALRQDNYSDFGNSINPKAALKWTPSRQLAFRSSFNTGFHAPSLYDLNGPRVRGVTNASHSDPVRCPVTGAVVDCGGQMRTLTGGNSSLQPEESQQWSVGLVAEPLPGASLTLDYFDIRRTNTIGTLSDDLVFANYAKYQGLVQRKSADAAYPSLPGQIDYIDLRTGNLGEIRTSGIDLSATLLLPKTEIGKFKLVLDGTRVLKYDYQIEKDGPWFDNLGRYAGVADGSGMSYRIIPRWRHYLALNWDHQNWSATLGNNYTSGYVDANTAGQGYSVAPYSTWDVSASYKGIKNLNLTAGILNILDTNPPFSNQGQTFHTGYDPKMTDPRGRMLFGRLVYKFK